MVKEIRPENLPPYGLMRNSDPMHKWMVKFLGLPMPAFKECYMSGAFHRGLVCTGCECHFGKYTPEEWDKIEQNNGHKGSIQNPLP